MDAEAHAAAAEKALQELRQATQVGSSKGKKEEQLKQISNCERLAKHMKDKIESYRLEVRALPKEEQGEHFKQLRNFEEGLKNCRAQIDWKRLDSERAPENGSAIASAALAEETDGPLTAEQALAMADETQNKSHASVARSKKMVLEAEQVGIATLDKMYAQEEQLGRIAEEVEDIKANIARSKKLVSQIARSAAGDRCIQILCLLITIAILVMITLAATGRDGGELNVPTQVRQTSELDWRPVSKALARALAAVRGGGLRGALRP